MRSTISIFTERSSFLPVIFSSLRICRCAAAIVLASGYTFLGIQTVCWADGAYWFGCYGSPRILLKADPQLNLTGRWKLDASLGLVAIPGGKLLVASGAKTPERRNTGALSVAVPDEQLGLRVLEAPAN